MGSSLPTKHRVHLTFGSGWNALCGKTALPLNKAYFSVQVKMREHYDVKVQYHMPFEFKFWGEGNSHIVVCENDDKHA